MTDPGIEPIRVGEHVTWFYWGRHPEHANLDMRLGGGSHAIHRGRSALMVDTMNLPGQAEWVKEYLRSERGVERFQVVNTHWHLDHVAGNHLFAEDLIVAHAETRRILLEKREGLEKGLWDGYPPIRVVLPNLTFEGRLDLYVEDLKVELHEFRIHERGHLSVYLPGERLLLAADMLEDPLWIFDFSFAPPEQQLAEYDRMLSLDPERILATHCSTSIVKAGGYDRRFIRNNADYLRRMLADAGHADFTSRPAAHYIGDALAAGELEWWEPYAEVHEANRLTIARRAWLAAERT